MRGWDFLGVLDYEDAGKNGRVVACDDGGRGGGGRGGNEVNVYLIVVFLGGEGFCLSDLQVEGVDDLQTCGSEWGGRRA